MNYKFIIAIIFIYYIVYLKNIYNMDILFFRDIFNEHKTNKFV